MLQGYKTYIIAFAIIVIAGLHTLGKIDDSLYNTLLTLLGGGGLATLSAKINRVDNKLQ